MNISYKQLEEHCRAWLIKANKYKRRKRSLFAPTSNFGKHRVSFWNRETEPLHDAFDRFMSLFVVFNMLYIEVGKVLLVQKLVKPPKKPYAPLPDRESATTHVVNYLGRETLSQEIVANTAWRRSVDEFTRAARDGFLAFHENYATGAIDIERDRKLMERANNYEPEAILELIYQTRCNLFHGRKEIISEQSNLLNSMSDFLELIIGKLLERLKDDIRN